MKTELYNHITEIYDGSAWEPVTGILWQDGQPWQLFKFEADVDYEGQTYRCVIIDKNIYDADDIEAIKTVETVFFEAWPI